MAKTASGPPSTHGTDPVPPRSNTTAGATPENNPQPDAATGGSAAVTASQKRGRGRPAKPKSDSKQNDAVSAQTSKKPIGRPKRNEAPAASVAAAKNTQGRATRSKTAAVTATTTADGSRKRGRPKKDDVAAATVAPVNKRGRKPTIGVAVAKPVRTTRKTSSSVAPVTSNVGDLKRKTALLQRKVKEAAAKLKIAVTAIEEVQKIAAEM